MTHTIPVGYYWDGKTVRPGDATVLNAVKVLLQHCGQDPECDGLKDTPRRVAKALTEMTSGYRQNIGDILKTTFSEDYDEIVVLKDIPFSSLCEHHLLPFTGMAHVGYLPGKCIVGLSKLARLVDCYAMRLQIQERMTREIAIALQSNLSPRGVAVVISAEHSCMGCRGVVKPGAVMTTSAMLGVFREKSEARAEFLALLK